MKHVETDRWNPASIVAGSSSASDDFGYIEPATAPSGLGGRLMALAGLWLERSKARRALARIPARDLRDAGLSSEAVEHELGRPFWRPLDRERK